jgi:hypothetical protein
MKLVKWVRCRVIDSERFDAGQRAWSDLGGQPGFLGQAGGWSSRESDVAHVFGCWADRPTYDTFMADDHDRIAGRQVGSYTEIDVRLFEHRLDVGPPLALGIAAGTALRLAHCHVHDDRVAHFTAAQAKVWNPGMGTATGMLGGSFGQRDETEFLVLSAWRTFADHERYVADRFPDLRRRAEAGRDLVSIRGDLISLQPAWTVAAGGG